MTDRYLFRGKRIDNGEWVDGYIIQYDTDLPTVGIFLPEEDKENAFHLVIPATIGQCIGIKDKNGRLVFEGDVVKLCDTNPILFIVSVEMQKYGWKCVFRYKDDGEIVKGAFLDKCETIGNIHDKEGEG